MHCTSEAHSRSPIQTDGMPPHTAPPTNQLDTGRRYIIRTSGHWQTTDIYERTPQSDIPRHRYFTAACPRHGISRFSSRAPSVLFAHRHAHNKGLARHVHAVASGSNRYDTLMYFEI